MTRLVPKISDILKYTIATKRFYKLGITYLCAVVFYDEASIEDSRYNRRYYHYREILQTRDK